MRLLLYSFISTISYIINIYLESSQERKLKDLKMKTAVNQKLIETGERERLKEVLRTRLIECGWRDQLKAYCKEIVNKKGVDNVTVDDLVVEITPKGRGMLIFKQEG